MDLLNEPRVVDWLAQFEPADRDAAVALLNAVNVIDSDAQDAALRELIVREYANEEQPVALFAAREPDGEERDRGLPYFDNGRPRALAQSREVGSEGRIARLIRDIARGNRRFLAHPSYDEMRSSLPRLLLVLDDLSASGNRVANFVRWVYSDVHIRSLHSYGRIRFHVAVCAATKMAEQRLRKDKLVGQFQFTTYARTFKTVGWSQQVQADVRALARKYGKRTRKTWMALGYGDAESLSILSSSCPNNVPAILWADGRTWRPLFPNAHVPEVLRLALLDGERLSLGERLREAGRDYMEQGLKNSTLSPFAQKLVALLAASTRFRVPYRRFEQLAMILGIPISEVRVLYQHAQRYSFLDKMGRITDSGRFELQQLRSRTRGQTEELPQVSAFYFPKSLKDQA